MLYNLGRRDYLKTADEIVDKLVEYESDIAWYEICDEFGNINTETEAMENFRHYLMETLQNTPEDILQDLKNEIEDFEFANKEENSEELKLAKELVNEIEEFRQAEEDLEM